MTKDMESLWERLKRRKRDALTRYKEACSKRSRTANVLLSLVLSLSFVLSLAVIAASVMVLFVIIDWETIANGTIWIFYSVFCMYHMAGFIGGGTGRRISFRPRSGRYSYGASFNYSAR